MFLLKIDKKNCLRFASRIAAILDAKRKQFFLSIFNRNNVHWVKSGQDSLIKASQFVERFGHEKEPIWLLGEGLVYYEKAFIADGVRFLDKEYWPAKARNVYLVGRRMARNADYADPSTLVPFYLRKPQAAVKRL